jgi:hypothetical protein
MLARRRPSNHSDRRILLRVLVTLSSLWVLGAGTAVLVAFRSGLLTGFVSLLIVSGVVLTAGWILAIVLAFRRSATALHTSAEEIADQSAVIAVNTSATLGFSIPQDGPSADPGSLP